MSTAITVTGEYLQWSVPAEKTTLVSAGVQSPAPKSQDENEPSGEPRTIFVFPHDDCSIKGEQYSHY